MEKELEAIKEANDILAALSLQGQGRVVNYLVGMVKERFDDAEAKAKAETP